MGWPRHGSRMTRSFVRLIQTCVGQLLLVGLGSNLAVEAATPDPDRVVMVHDENRDGRFTGEDVEVALERCRPGCVLSAGSHVFEDVAIAIDGGFPNGLVIQGAGRGKTIFRSSVPAHAPIFWIKGGLSGIVFRDFGMDGRKREQNDAASISESVGIRVSNPALVPSPLGYIESLDIGNFLTAGIWVRDGSNWTISGNRVHDVGCDADRPCPLLPGGDADPYVKGRRTVGYGIVVVGAGARGAVIEGNTISRVSKIGIEAFTPGSALGSDDRVRDVRIFRNRVNGALSAGIVANGGVGIRIEGNEVWDSGGTGVRGQGASGINCGGASDRVVIARNYIHDTDGSGIRIGCSGDLMEIVGNQIERPCRRQLAVQGALHLIGGGKGARRLMVMGNFVDATRKGCAYSLFAARWQDVTISEGTYRGGTRAVFFVADILKVRVQGRLDLSRSGKVPLWVRSDVREVRIGTDTGLHGSDVRVGAATRLIYEGS